MPTRASLRPPHHRSRVGAHAHQQRCRGAAGAESGPRQPRHRAGVAASRAHALPAAALCRSPSLPTASSNEPAARLTGADDVAVGHLHSHHLYSEQLMIGAAGQSGSSTAADAQQQASASGRGRGAGWAPCPGWAGCPAAHSAGLHPLPQAIACSNECRACR